MFGALAKAPGERRVRREASVERIVTIELSAGQAREQKRVGEGEGPRSVREEETRFSAAARIASSARDSVRRRTRGGRKRGTTDGRFLDPERSRVHWASAYRNEVPVL